MLTDPEQRRAHTTVSGDKAGGVFVSECSATLASP